MDLFDHAMEQDLKKKAPLAARLRPRTLDEFVGQEDIVGEGKLLYRAGIDTEELHIIEIDPAAADDKNVTPRNHLITDRRTDLYPT